ncbi:QVPTGV class sortase B protein-sorting domain-containing protein [Terrisporobacter vanillatitrophus]
MGLENSTNYAFGIPTNFIYIALGIVIIGGGLYLYKKLKSKK